jgi:DNA-directed RNA polymerase subunit K/omega
MDDLRIQSKILHPEVQAISRETVDPRTHTTMPYYTKYEYTTLVGLRAQQLADGAKPLVSLSGMDKSSPQFVTKLAQKEIHEQVLPFIVHRRLPNGVSEYWSAKGLRVMW